MIYHLIRLKLAQLTPKFMTPIVWIVNNLQGFMGQSLGTEGDTIGIISECLVGRW